MRDYRVASGWLGATDFAGYAVLSGASWFEITELGVVWAMLSGEHCVHGSGRFACSLQVLDRVRRALGAEDLIESASGLIACGQPSLLAGWISG